MPSTKLVGFDLSLVYDTYGEFNIRSIGATEYTPNPITYLEIPSITTWPNSGDLITANATGEDGELWLKQTINDNFDGNQIIMIVEVGEEQYEISSYDFIGGRPPHRPTS